MNAAIVQARMGSSRLPGKVLKDIAGKPILYHLINRVKKIKNIDKIVVATTQDEIDDELIRFCEDNNIKWFRGSKDDVLDRYLQCANQIKAKIIVRVCGDDPIIAPDLIDSMIEKLLAEGCDYCGVSNEYPCIANGVEVFTNSALEKQTFKELTYAEKEHVTLYMKTKKGFKNCYIEPPLQLQRDDIRLTVDTQADLDFIREIYSNMKTFDFDIYDVIKLIENKPKLKQINSHVKQKNVNIRSVKVLLIVKKVDVILEKNLKYIFTELNHIGLDLLEAYKEENDISKLLSCYDILLIDKSASQIKDFQINNNKFIQVNINNYSPEKVIKSIFKKLEIL